MAFLGTIVWRAGFLLLLCTLFPPGIAGGAGASSESQVKAAFLLNFARFTQWPAGAFAGPAAPLVIVVVGDEAFAGSLDEVIRGEKVDGHPLVVRRVQQVEEIRECHILFLGASRGRLLPQVAARLPGRSILTVGDGEGFPQRGGVIGFVTGATVKFRINVEAARAANLTLSSKLLRAAEIVASGKG